MGGCALLGVLWSCFISIGRRAHETSYPRASSARRELLQMRDEPEQAFVTMHLSRLAENGRIAESVNPPEADDKGTHMCPAVSPAARVDPAMRLRSAAPVTSQGPAV